MSTNYNPQVFARLNSKPKFRKSIPKLNKHLILLRDSRLFSNGKRGAFLISMTIALSLSVTLLTAILRVDNSKDFLTCAPDKNGNLPSSCGQCEYVTEVTTADRSSESALLNAAYSEPSCLSKILKSCAIDGLFNGNYQVNNCLANSLSFKDSSDVFSQANVLDSQCKVVDSNSIAKNSVCRNPNMTNLATPVSLLWNNAVKIRDVVSIVKFPLDPNQPEAWVKWRGSADTPLLVYDPEHNAKIESAFQLFGPWTFGGKGNSPFKQVSMDMQKSSKRAWNHGFEALALLDKNHDGRVSGKELEPLALWFDINQDAVSEPSEIHLLGEMGITALYYSVDGVDKQTKDVYVKSGFARVFKGRLQIGSSVDWTTELSKSGADAVVSETANRIVKQFNTNSSSGSTFDQAENGVAGLRGIWKLELDNKTSESPQIDTMLTLSEHDGVLNGNSYSELPLKALQNTNLNLKSMLVANRLNGTKAVSEDGQVIISFTSKNDGLITNSTAFVSPDGQTLTGESTVKDISGKATNYTYKWQAKAYTL